jgi:putative peptidoglycan lipid II flippase
MRPILKNSIAVVIGTLLYKVGFLAKDIVLTSKMGMGQQLTLFVTAFLIPSFLSNTIAQSLQVSSTAEVMRSDKTISSQFLLRLFVKVLSLGVAGYALLHFLVPFVFTSFAPSELGHLRQGIWLSLPFFLTMPIRGVLGQVLYIREYYLLNFSLALVCPVGMIGYIMLASHPEALGLMQVLAVASVCELIVVYSVVKIVGGIGSHHSSDFGHRKILSGFTFQSLLMLPPLIDQLIAHWFDAQFLTAFSYASKIPNILTTVSMIVASSVFLPFFIEKTGREVPTPKRLIALLAVLFWLTTPFLSPLIVELVFQRGAFTAEDTAQIAALQTLYFISAPLTAIFMVYIRFLNAKGQNREATLWLVWLCSLSLFFGLMWKYLGRHDLIPVSILLSYLILLGRYFLTKKGTHAR